MDNDSKFEVLTSEDFYTTIANQIGKDFMDNVLGNDDYFTFIHVADTHNGYSGNTSRYNEFSALRVDRKNERDVNIRQDDFDKAFTQVIDYAVGLNVDAVLHAGDGTDSWGYKRAYVLNTYMSQVERLSKIGTDYVEIIGNHNLPKTSATGTYLEIIGKLPNVHSVYKGGYTQIEFPKHNSVIHCVPSTFNQDIMDKAFEEVERRDGVINIGLSHVGVKTIPFYAENSGPTLVTTLDTLIKCKMDYFALGDYHTPTDFGFNIKYSGATERNGLGESHINPQIFLVGIHKKTREVISRDIFLKVRPMYDLEAIDIDDLINKDIHAINTLIVKRLTAQDLSDAIVRLRVSNLPKEYKYGIDIDIINELTEQCLYFKLDLHNKTEKALGTRTASHVKLEGVLEGWHTFMNNIEEDGTFNKETLTQNGYKKLQDALDKKID